MKDYIFRKAGLQDLSAIGQIFRDAVSRMLDEGKKQWTENYPTDVHALADINRGDGYILESEGRVAVYGAVIFTGEPAYSHLRGKWLRDVPYVVVHRMAVAKEMQHMGIAGRFLASVERLAIQHGVDSFRVDTNFDNDRMLNLLKSCGFNYCGEITYESGDRIAFEKEIRK